MSERTEVAELVRQWLEKAANDLITAEHTLELAEGCPYDSVCFHAQQCVEKCLKAALTCEQAPFGKTHDLEELRLLLPVSLTLPASVEDLARLTPYATNVRYPGPWSYPTREEAEWAVAVARRISQAVRVWLAECS
jgi:HEPN domain-containing protein